MHGRLKNLTQSLGCCQPRLLILRSVTRVIAVCALLLLLHTVSTVKSYAADTTNPIPVFAYYYIWFDPQSWDRAKIDYPLLGRYSSDDRSVMVQHIKWAKNAGITGFI